MIEISSGTMVTGASDDLIEICGDIREEFNAYDCSDGTMAFSDGTLLGVEYDKDGIWRFKVICKVSLYDKKVEGSNTDDTNDEVYFHHGLKWVEFSDEMQCEVVKS
jgi:hypothetical protein